MPKRKLDGSEVDPNRAGVQNSLDSDEEDVETNEDAYNVMNENDFEGVEDGPSAPETNIGFTAFNMKEELEEGHFDKDGHYLWKKEKQIRDNWLDNIDWVRVKETPAKQDDKETDKGENVGVLDTDSDEEDRDITFDPTSLYKEILEYLQPGETVSKALCRLGKGKKRLTTSERWKRKKEAKPLDEDVDSDKIMKLTELANTLLTRTGNMDIYQENYEQIKKKIELRDKHAHPSTKEAELDMYADDFSSKETEKLGCGSTENAPSETTEEVTWELKWSQEEKSEVHGPHTTKEMNAWAKEGYFKRGAWVRRTGQTNQFYSASRVDFELYL